MESNVDLLSPFPQELVRKAPAGKFGDYVPHAHYVERLRDSGVKYTWQCEAVYGTYNGEQRIVGAKGPITIDGMGSYDGFGDVATFKLGNAKFNDGTNLKDAESDAFKRAAVLWGIGRYLYALPNTWCELEGGQRIKAPPALPTWATPEGYQQILEKK